MRWLRFRWLAILLALGWTGNASAAIMLQSFGNLTWDRILSPSGSATVTIPISWDGSGDASLDGFNLGVMITKSTDTSTPTTDLTVGSTVTFPTTNAVFPAFYTPAPSVTPVATGVTGIQGAISSLGSADVTLTTSPVNALVFNFASPTSDALGVYNVYATKDFSVYFDSLTGLGDYDGAPFSNASSSNYLLGTVTVVPEPGTIAGLATGGLCVVGMAWRYHRRRAKAKSLRNAKPEPSGEQAEPEPLAGNSESQGSVLVRPSFQRPLPPLRRRLRSRK
jgi:hypothetical protein